MGLGLGDGGRLISLEHDEHWLSRSHGAVERTGLADRVELVHAPLTPVPRDGNIYLAHEYRAIRGLQVDLLFVDAPPGRIGRRGTLPRLRPHLQRGALVILDDAARIDEQECIRAWIREGLVRFRGYVAVGRGLAILETR
jgi:predicted O-methyltransferase YrrM